MFVRRFATGVAMTLSVQAVSIKTKGLSRLTVRRLKILPCPSYDGNTCHPGFQVPHAELTQWSLPRNYPSYFLRAWPFHSLFLQRWKHSYLLLILPTLNSKEATTLWGVCSSYLYLIHLLYLPFFNFLLFYLYYTKTIIYITYWTCYWLFCHCFSYITWITQSKMSTCS